MRRIQRGKEHILCHDAACCQRVEQCGLSGIGIADQSDDTLRGPLPFFTLQPPRAANIFKVTAEFGNLVVQYTPVTLNLRLAWPGQEALSAALTLQVGPGSYQTGTFITQPREFDLQPPFFGGGAETKNFKDKTRAVNYLAFPISFQIALLNWRKSGIYNRQRRFAGLNQSCDFLNLAFSKEI